MRALVAMALLAPFVIASQAAAEPMPARETAEVLRPGRWSAGIVSPIAVGVAPGIEVKTSLVPWFLLSPSAAVRVELARFLGGDVVATGEYGLGMPTGAMRLLQGYLFPIWETSGNKPGFVLVPSAGFLVSGHVGARGVWTGSIDTSVGVPLGDNPATPLETYAPLELLFAPALNGYRLRIGAAYDHAILDWLRLHSALNGYAIGASPYPPRSPFTVSAELGLEVGLGKTVRIALGGAWYNSDQREKILQRGTDGRWKRVGVRSNDFFPTFDLILRPR